jgi:energy-converting hydrogenase A subunit M
MYPSMEVVAINLNKMLLGQYFDSCLGKHAFEDFRRSCVNEKILGILELCVFCRVVRMVEMNFEVMCSVYIEVKKYNLIPPRCVF